MFPKFFILHLFHSDEELNREGAKGIPHLCKEKETTPAKPKGLSTKKGPPLVAGSSYQGGKSNSEPRGGRHLPNQENPSHGNHPTKSLLKTKKKEELSNLN